MKTAVIVPGIEVERGGIAAYAVELARRWPGGLAETVFVTPAVSGEIPSDVERGSARASGRDAERLAAELHAADAGAALLHYSGYGYAPDACPQWLLDGLARWKQARPAAALQVFFHELATEEPWWRRTAWSQPRQRRIIGGIARLAERVATSCPHFVAGLRVSFGIDAARLAMVPVPPTLATAPGAPPPVKGRTRDLTALVFGLAGTRQRTLREHGALLRRLVTEGIVARLVVAGQGATAAEARNLRHGTLTVAARPDLEAEEFMALAREADFGLTWNWAPILTKSTVFANLCALGLPAIVGERAGSQDTGLPIEPAMLACNGRADNVRRIAAAIAEPATRATLQANARRLAETVLGWPSVATTLARHFRA